MKKHLLFNQSFGTEGSPNQTGETQTRENRIGLMSYLRRTLMLLFAVLVMSIANIGMAWGVDITVTRFALNGTTIYAINEGNKMFHDEVEFSLSTTPSLSSNKLNVPASSVLTIGAHGKTITKIVIEWNAANNSSTFSTGTATWKDSNKTMTWTGSTTSLAITSGAASRVNSAVITYTDADPLSGVTTTTLSSFSRIYSSSGACMYSSKTNSAYGVNIQGALDDKNPVGLPKNASNSLFTNGLRLVSPKPISSVVYTWTVAPTAASVSSGTYNSSTSTWTAANTTTTEVTIYNNGTGQAKFSQIVVNFVGGTPTHTLTWELDGGTATGGTAAGSVADGATLTAPTVTKDGYDFAGWTPEVPSTMPSSNATYTAQWTKVYASGTYVFEGNNSLGTVPYNKTCGTGTNLDFRIDNIFFAGGTYEYDDTNSGGSGDGDNFNGWKWKTNNATIKFFVEEDCDVTIGIGSIGESGGATITYTNQSNVPQSNVALTAATNNVYKVKGGTMVTVAHNNSTKTVTLKKIIISSGSCPDAWSFHSKNSSSEWRDPICMELEGDGDFYISEETAINVGDVSYKVGYQGVDEAKTTETDWQWMPMGPARNWTVGAHPTASNAGGALGYFYIHSSYTDNNRYIGFFPSSYMLRQGSGESWSNTTFNPASSAYGETVWTTTVQKFTASNAADYMYTALGTGNGGAVGCAMSTAMRPIYLKLHSDWKASSPKFYIYYFKNGTDKNGWSGLMQAVSGTGGDDLVGWIPEGDWDRVQFVRFNPGDAVASWEGNVWNSTYAITLDSEKNYYVLEAQGNGGALDWYGHWDLYHNGFYRIWVDNASTNFALHYVPQYVLEYDNNGGNGSIDPQYVALDADPNTVTVKAVTGFTAPEGKHFVNWNTAPGGGGTSYAPNDSYSLTANGTLYAQWAWDTYNVSTSLTQVSVKTGTTGTGAATHGSAYTVTLQGETGYNLPASVTVMRGSTDITANCTWTQGTGVLIIPAAQVTGNISITASGVAKTTAITLEAGEGGTDGSATATYGTSTITDYVAATRTGYTLGKYQDGSKNNILTNEGELNSGDKGSILDDGLWVYDGATITLYAQWTAIEYTLSYNLNGGSVASDNPTSYTIESSAITLNNPTKTGYTFAGWTGTGLDAATTAVTIAAGSTGNRSYTATWTAIVPSSVSLNKTSTTIEIEGTETLTATISPADVADNTITWTSSDETVATVTSAGVVTGVKAGTATITATTHNDKSATCEVTVAPAVTYTVTYVYNGADGGSQPASATGSSVSLPNPTKEGYTLQGWYTSSGSLAGAATATYNPTSDITLYALWREDACAGGGGGSTTIILNWFDQDQKSNVSNKPTSLSKWLYGYTNSAKTRAYAYTIATACTDNKDKAKDNTLYMKYGGTSVDIYADSVGTSGTPSTFSNVTKVALRVKLNNASAASNTLTIKVGSTTVANAVSLSGANTSTFKEYSYDDLSDLSGVIQVTNNGGSTTSYSIFIDSIAITYGSDGDATCYYVTYNGNGADGGFTKDEASHPSGSDVTVASNSFTKTGYTFNGWKTEPSGGTSYAAGGTISGISGNMTLYAQWEESGSTYGITYHCNDATSGCPDNATGQVALPDPLATPTKTNYSFGGWYTDEGLTDAAVAGATLDDDADLYAKWTQTITLKTGTQGSGADKTPTVVWQGTALNGFSAHTATGYTLQGYYTAGSGGVKVLNANGTFASANVDGYITSSKWSRTGAAPTLFAQWVASEDCSTSDFVIQKGSSEQYQGCMESSSYNGTATSFTAGSPTTVGNAKMTISNYDGGIKRPGSGNTFSIVIEPVSGYYLKSICWAGKVESGETVSYYWNDNSGSPTTISAQTTSGTGVTYNAPSSTTKFTASYVDDGVDGGGIWWRNVQVEVCAAGVTTYSVTYDGNDETGGTAPTDASSPYAYGTTVTVLGNTGSLAKTNYTFAGWTTNDNGTGSSYEAGSTFSITANTTLYAKWTQAVTLNKNGGSTDGSATAVWNATGLTGITHAKPAAGYKLLGYYSASSDGTKVLNSDGSFAATNVTDYITDGKWSRTSATTLYAEYESAGALTWNLIVNSDTSALSTSTKTSAFTEISTANMSNATVNGLTYNGNAKASLTGKISTPASYDADDYVYVTFQVASGYKFTPTSVSVKVQPVGEGEDKSVKLSLTDASESLVSASATKCDGTTKGKTTTVTLAGDGTEFTGTVTLKIYVYNYSGSSTANNCYRLGTPITIEGEIEEACATMPSYTSMSYTTTTFAPGADASGSPITIVGGTNINTYQWKYNTVNDRTSGTNCGTGTSLTPLTNASATEDGTRYYWCEMTNTSCGITIKSPAVAITVAAAKSDATVTWTDPASTPNYGGGGYTIKATVNEIGWDGNAADLVITAPAGINIYNVSSGTTSSQKWVQADFDVQTSFDRTTYASNIPFTVSAAATASYNAISNDRNVSYSACAGAGEGSSYYICMRKTVTKDGNYYHCANTDGWISPNISSSYSTGKAGTTMAIYFDTVASSNTQYVWVRTYHANINKVRIYADFRANDMTVSNVYKHTAYFSADSKYAVDYTEVYNGDEENENTGTAAQGYVDITLDEVMAANDILLVKFNDNKVRPLGAVITESSAGSINTGLTWSSGTADGGSVTGKTQSSANFTITATRDAAAAVSLGAITYSSSNTSCATVNATTGEVTITASGKSDLSTTIKATLAASGCYKKKEITYTLTIPGVTCTIEHGTLTSDVTSKCSTENATLTLTGFESGATLQWYKGESTISDGATYDISDDGTTLVTKEAGTYSVMVTNSAETCSDRSNSITISNISATASVTKIVDEWYVKNGRLTPDIELWSLSEGTTLKSVAWSPDNETGLSCVARGGVIYLEGKSPSSNDSGDDIEYTLTATITDECNADHIETTKTIKITHQKNTDKHVLAFVVTGTEKGGFTAGITAAQTTSVGLYNTIATNFDVLATNIYSTDDEKKLKEYYSQFDILCITDYPNTKTKGVNKKSYVDALGALVDIRPILTMEAWVSGLTNWKAKGISGTPSSPTTRQYTMLLQCKDHEIFSGTKLTKVGEGDETMYRISMVCDTLEDYKTLDATYGEGAHADKSGYEYASKPALQGFTFDATMADDGLLPLGLIDDGSGNDLQVGIERQTEMEARLMVLGINSYAMERLTDDGQTVVVNALKYLMKKNSEDIADCSNTFVGGDDEEDESTRYDWNVDSHWSGNAIPDRTQKVRIVAPCVIKAGEKFHVTGVVIAPIGKYNHGANTANGSLTIAAGGALIVDGKVEAATAPLYTETRATTPANLTIGSTETNGNGTLIFDNEDGSTQAIVEYYSKATTDEASSWSWQYMAVPFNDNSSAYRNYYDSYLYRWAEDCSGWEIVPNRGEVYPWVGYTITQVGEKTYVMDGTLVETGEMEFTVPAGKNLVLGNSWTAPIQVKQFTDDDFANMSKNVYLFNTGYDEEGTGSFSGTRYEGGTYVTIPIHSSPYSGDSLISSLQAFIVYAKADGGGGTFTLDYDRHVRPARSTDKVNAGEMHAPKRGGVINDKPAVLKVWASGSRYDDRLVVLERGDFSTGLDEGWDGNKRVAGNSSPLIFAVTDNGREAVSAIPTMEGTLIGFWAGEDNEYTLHFEYNEEDELYLLDLDNNTYTPVNSNSTYVFTVPDKKAHNRFILTRNAPDPVATGVEEMQASEKPEAKAIKFLKDEKVFIFVNGKLYDATGKVVK